MPFILETLFFCLLVFLFCVFVLSKDDFILLRKNVSLEELFNISIIGGIISLILSRAGFAVSNLKSSFISPLIFLAIPYFPGLSLAFGIIGFCIYVYIYSSRKKFPTKRIFDVMTISSSLAISFGNLIFFITNLIIHKKINFFFISGFLFYAILFAVLAGIFTKTKIKDGDTSIWGLISISLSQVIFISLMRGFHNLFRIGVEDIIYLIGSILLILYLLKNAYWKKIKIQ